MSCFNNTKRTDIKKKKIYHTVKNVSIGEIIIIIRVEEGKE